MTELSAQVQPRAVAGIAVATALALVSAAALTPGASPGQAPGCRPPATLSAGGKSGADRFTMLLRVNQLGNARAYARPAGDGGLRGRLRQQDVFLVNTRFPRTDPDEQTAIVDTLRGAFPCNRIFALNGLGANPGAPGYAFALAGNPQVSTVLVDWEKHDWNASRGSAPRRPRWSGRFGHSLKRARRILRRLGSVAGKRVGLAPDHLPRWRYGQLGRVVDAQNRRQQRRRKGFQSVQTQGACQHGGYRRTVRRLLRQYKRANFRRHVRKRRKGRRVVRRIVVKPRRPRLDRRNLGLQISFSDTPNRRARMPILATSPGKASKCVQVGLKRGAGAFLFWASPRSMDALFATRRICRLRPPPSGGC